MVVISVSVCSKNGKVLFARQYVSMSKLRVETMLSTFIQIINKPSYEERDLRFIDSDTENIRYLYKSFEEMYLVMITDKQSNLFTHIKALETISKLLPKHCSDEDHIKQNAFNLIYAMDEVINPMGSIQPLTMNQIHDYVEMNSAEERLCEIICKSKIQNCSSIMKNKAYQFDGKIPEYIYECNTIGLSLGGAKDVNNFRECIEQNIMPSIGSITYNGLLYEYYFNTTTTRNMIDDDDGKEGDDDDDTMLFYPSYCYAKVKKMSFMMDTETDDDDKNEYEYYMSIGLNSNIIEDDFKRKKLNLVIVLDKSGSMASQMVGNCKDSKIKTAAKAIVELLKHLTPDDRFGFVTFESKSMCIQSLDLVRNIDMKWLKSAILNERAEGGTNFEFGYKAAVELYQSLFKMHKDVIDNESENRIIMLTDAQPNRGYRNPHSLMMMVSKYAEFGTDNSLLSNRIYTTFIGVGLDFNVSLIEKISDIRGCNYYSVNSIDEFMRRMDEEFEYMVTPLVFNVCLKLNCEGNVCEIEKVFGSNNEKDIIQNGEITTIKTLFPSKRCAESGEVKGGIQLIKLLRKDELDPDAAINVEIEVTFEDRNGKRYENKQMVAFSATSKEYNDMIENKEDDSNNYYDNIGIRKAILLCKYGELLMNWIQPNSNINSSNYIQIFTKFLHHLRSEMLHCNDDTLQKEVVIMNQLIHNSFTNYKSSSSNHIANDDDEDSSELPSIEIIISERLCITLDQDGALKNFDIKGDLQIIVNDPAAAQCAIVTNINPSKQWPHFNTPIWRIHPRMDSYQWQNGILCMKDTHKKFRVGKTRNTSILKWKMSTSNDSNMPITVEVWPEMESNGNITVNAQYVNGNSALKNVVIEFPISEEPQWRSIESGDVTFNKHDDECRWILNDLEADSEGSLEFIVASNNRIQIEDLWPIYVYFEIQNAPYSQLEIKEIHDVHNGQQLDHKVKAICFADKYCITV